MSEPTRIDWVPVDGEYPELRIRTDTEYRIVVYREVQVSLIVHIAAEVPLPAIQRLGRQYRLSTECGTLQNVPPASAVRNSDTEAELFWAGVKPDMVLTVSHTLGEGSRVLLAKVPYKSLVQDGHIPTNGK